MVVTADLHSPSASDLVSSYFSGEGEEYGDDCMMYNLEGYVHGYGTCTDMVVQPQVPIDDLEKACNNDPKILQAALAAEQGSGLPPGMARRALLREHADYLYGLRQNAKAHDPDLLSEDDSKANHAMRNYRWGSDRLGLSTRSEKHTTAIRNTVSLLMKHTCDDEELAEKDADGVYGYLRPQYVRNQLGNVPLITNMLSELYQGRDARLRAWAFLLQFLEMTGHPQIKEYIFTLKEEKPYMTNIAKKKLCLNPADLSVVHRSVKKLVEDTQTYLQHPEIAEYEPVRVGKRQRLAYIMMTLSALWTVSTGASASHACLRNDINSLVYNQSGMDLQDVNWIDTSGDGCKFTFNYLNKVNPKGGTVRGYFREALVIDVMQHNKPLALFVREFEPIAKTIRDTRNARDGTSNPAYLYFNYGQRSPKDFGNPVDNNTVTTRIRRAYEYMGKDTNFEITKDMAARLTGVTACRNVLEAQARLNLETPEERSDRQARSGRARTDHSSDGYGRDIAPAEGNGDQDDQGNLSGDDGEQSSNEGNPSLANDCDGDDTEETGSDVSLASAEEPATSSPQE